MEYQVPQFTEIEDKIFGPFTLWQFIYLAGGAGMTALLLLFLPFLLGLILSAPIIALSVALAFLKINGKSFLELLQAGLTFYTSHKEYRWKKEKVSVLPVTPRESASPQDTRQKLRLSPTKLKELAWSLDVKRESAPDDIY